MSNDYPVKPQTKKTEEKSEKKEPEKLSLWDLATGNNPLGRRK